MMLEQAAITWMRGKVGYFGAKSTKSINGISVDAFLGPADYTGRKITDWLIFEISADFGRISDNAVTVVKGL